MVGEEHVSDPLLLRHGELPDIHGSGTPKLDLAGRRENSCFPIKR
ncbi:hypothetical protein [Bradyrhizobium sp. JR3.5]